MRSGRAKGMVVRSGNRGAVASDLNTGHNRAAAPHVTQLTRNATRLAATTANPTHLLCHSARPRLVFHPSLFLCSCLDVYCLRFQFRVCFRDCDYRKCLYKLAARELFHEDVKSEASHPDAYKTRTWDGKSTNQPLQAKPNRWSATNPLHRVPARRVL